MKIEVRAVGLKAMREKRGLTERQLAHDLGISQNYIPAIEANSAKPDPSSSSRWCDISGADSMTCSRSCWSTLRPSGSKYWSRGSAALVK
jgi:predicted transcriptional regulator